MTILLMSGFVSVVYCLVDLHVVRHEELLGKWSDLIRRSYFRESHRGDVYDSKGHLLATSRPVKTVCADPLLVCNKHIGNCQGPVAQVLGPLLDMKESELHKLLQIRILTNAQGKLVVDQYVVLKRNVQIDKWEQIQSAMGSVTFGVDEGALPKRLKPHFNNVRNRAIFAEEEQERTYPNGMLAAHLIGHVGVAERRTPYGMRIQTEGKDGIEFAWNSALSGVPGWRETEIDERKRELVEFRRTDVLPRPGLNVVLTLDIGLQEIIESELAVAMNRHNPVSVSAIVVRPRTGEILSMATLPSYDPNDPGQAPPEFRRNRLVTDIAEPGSTFKVIAVSAALNEGAVGLGDKFDCEQGAWIYGGHALHDHERFGILTVEEIIAKSSNIGAAKIGIRLGPERLYDYMLRFGFGQRTGIPLPGEQPGIMHPLRKWQKISVSRVPVGYEVAVTPLQMIMAISAIANGGWLMRPMLVDRLEDQYGNVVVQYKPQVIRQVCSELTTQKMKQAMKKVVSPEGTAAKARLQNIVAAGKTGTARKAGPGGYMAGKYFSSFYGFLPADRPEICIGVVMDEPHDGYYGSQTAAPVFKNIAERAVNYLGIQPEYLPGEILATAQMQGQLTGAQAN